MKQTTEEQAAAQPLARQVTWQRAKAKLKRWVPFASGMAAVLLGLLFYNLLNPPAQPMTTEQVSTAVAEAMASATPAPAFSAQVYGVIQPSLVLIQTGPIEGVTEDSDKVRRSLGSGVIITGQGEILTALHVVDGAESVQVTFADGTETSAQVIATQPENDIALLMPDRLPQVLIPAVMGNPYAMSVGDEAFAAGNPFGLYGSFSAGVISGMNRSFQGEDNQQTIENLIQFDTAVNPGNSGGPLLNRAGQVVGIVVGILNPTEDEFFVGIGFAVPITVAASGGGGGGPQY